MQKLRQKTKRKKNATRKKSRNTTNIKMKTAMYNERVIKTLVFQSVVTKDSKIVVD